ncbi:MAG: 1,4-dihydroxy-2-naphthoate polyprenyltransferase [Verrucomicrobiales bacterium]
MPDTPPPTAQRWIHAARPKTLPAALVPVAVGCAIAYGLRGAFDATLALCTMLSAAAIQIATNFFNDAIDFHRGADTERRLGPKRITASGEATPRQVMAAGALAVLAAAALAAPLVMARGWPIVAIGLPSVYFTYGYTGGPLPLAYRGLGELFVFAFFGIVAVAGTCFVQIGEWPAEALLGGAQVGLFSCALLAINNLRDTDEDAQSGKRTLAVRFGKRFARAEIAAFCLAPYALGIAFAPLGFPAAAWLPLLALPLSLALIRGIYRHDPGAIYNKFLAFSALQLLAFALLQCIGLVLR